MVDYLHDIHKQVKQTIDNNNATYKAMADTHRKRVVYEVGNLVWVVFTRDKFLVDEYNKLKKRKICSCEVL